MSVRFDAATDYLERTTDLPSTTSFTYMTWMYMTAFVTGYNMVFTRRGNQHVNLGFDNSGSHTYVLGDDSFDRLGTTSGATATWYHLAWVSAGQNGNYCYLNGALEINNVSMGAAIGSTAIYEGQYTTSGENRLNGRTYATKIWDAQLTGAEILAEMYTVRPARYANLYGWWPHFPGATERLADWSGNGRNWTAGGTLTDEDPPPVAWGGRPIYIVTPPAVAGGLSIPVAMYNYRRRRAG